MRTRLSPLGFYLLLSLATLGFGLDLDYRYTWIGGTSSASYPIMNLPVPPIYDRPAPRIASCGAFDTVRREYWLFGGNGYTGDTNDLWKYKISDNSWTWIGGTNDTNSPGSYDQIGVSSPSNIPRARQGCTAWFNSNRIQFYLYGGRNVQSTTATLNDVWQFDVSSRIWTLLSGGNATDQVGDYSSSVKFPGARWGHLTFYDESSDQVWMFGGSGYNTAAASAMNDLWRFDLDTVSWSWLSGSDSSPQCSIISNQVCSRYGANGWMTVTDIYIFGGNTFTGSSIVNTNDVWRFSKGTTSWTFVAGSVSGDVPINNPSGSFGVLGVANASNVPPSRAMSSSWYDATQSEFWIFGKANMNDLWKFSPAFREWTWMGGTNIISHDGNIPTPAVPTTGAVPGSREASMAWYDPATRRGWLFGGVGYHSGDRKGMTNEVWSLEFASTAWTWFPGSFYPSFWGTYGLKGVSDASNRPCSRYGANTFTDPNSGDLYMFGGIDLTDGLSSGLWSDLWRFSPSDQQWTWISGSGTPNHPSYGVLGVPNRFYYPRGRSRAAAAFDAGSRELWVFGGYVYGSSSNVYVNDLWRYRFNDSTWTWVAGTQAERDPGSANYPSARLGASAWFDQSNKTFWLFGGLSIGGLKSDLWRFSTVEQKWYFIPIGTTDLTDNTGAYSTNVLQVNYPGSRTYSCSWTNEERRELYLLGGYGRAISADPGNLDDLWAFNLDTQKWYWVSGNPSTGAPPVHGTKGVASTDNTPGARSGASCSFDSKARELWLFGGAAADKFNDLWKYSMRDGSWTWMAGNDTDGQPGFFDPLGSPSLTATPGGRVLPAVWASSKNQEVWIFAGQGYTEGERLGSVTLGDLWRFSPICASCNKGNCTGSVAFESTCPSIDCTNRTSGFVDGTKCGYWSSSVSGRCGLTGKCDVDLNSRCPETSLVVVAECGSSLCQGSCSSGLSAASLNGSNICRTVGQCTNSTGTCGIGGVCSVPPSAPPVSSPVSQTPTASSNATGGADIGLAVGASVGVVAGLIALGLLLFVILLRRKRRSSGRNTQYTDVPDDVKHLFSVKYSDLDIGAKLGEGSFGSVFLAKYKGQPVAVKKLNSISSSAIGDFFRESSIMMSVKQNPNVTRLIGLCQEAGNFCIVLEFLKNGALSSYLEKNGPLKDPALKTMVLGIANGMASLAEQRIVHRDLASRNILLDDKDVPKISDFGFSRVVGDEGIGKTTSTVGPIRWMAPEAIRTKQFSEKSDVWSFGCTIIELITGEQPYGDADIFDVAVKLRDQPGYHPDIPETAPEWAKELLPTCWNEHPEMRPTFTEIIAMLNSSHYQSMDKTGAEI
eukprot:TRINITY_DN6778_c0_g1_i1.p1 TRINITY_DN6778_c0_g1~~TRINITY_DN6778_c0_g1_i1.p1  ORF type:complete len:1331 (+),score=177.31 TRINITY_DN6778_c0_g1_i1:128-4120(+)